MGNDGLSTGERADLQCEPDPDNPWDDGQVGR